MATAGPSTARTAFFKQLKPICVPLSQLAIRSPDKAAGAKEVLGLLQDLTRLWESQAAKDASILDEKLADYVFFPVSHVLRNQDQYPIRVIEAAIRALRVLVQHGWKGKISGDLSQQLLIFLTFVVGGVPGQDARRDVPEETVLEGYRTLSSLVKAIGSASLTPVLTAEQAMPTLGHAVSIVLDGVVDGTTPDIQLAALDCLEAFYSAVKDHAALASFLPGTVSSLTKALSPPQSLKAQKRVLVRGLSVLGTILCGVLGDLPTRNILKAAHQDNLPQGRDGETGELTPAWLRATASQIKIALSSVLKLRSRPSQDVQRAVSRLCISLLDECHASLSECKHVLVETAMTVDDGEASQSLYETSLQDLTSIYPELGDTIRVVLYNWLGGLPRLMQSSDEGAKQQAIRHFLRGNKLATSSGLDSSTLEDSLVDALRDSVVALVLGSKTPRAVDSVEPEEDLWKSTTLTKTALSESSTLEYKPVLLDLDGQRDTRNEIRSLIENIGPPARKIRLAADMLGHLRDSEGADRLASFWLSLELVKSSVAPSPSSDVDSLLDLSQLDDRGPQDAILRELYDFSASILTAHSDAQEADWRLEAIALEVAAFSAGRMQAEFRPELIDVLFPITTFLGSQNPRLRRHAITTLNAIATSCGYASVSELVVDNADYMVNSVSLRLNTFDISPAATRVLTMMIRLTGPQLIPFLDDVVAAVFAGLDNYHGYPVFVESLFAVLSEVVEQGAKSDALLVEGTKRLDHRKRPPESGGVDGILDALEERGKKKNRTAGDEEADEEIPRGHPEEPWGPPKKHKSFIETLEEQQEEPEDERDPAATDKPKAPATPTYTLLARITTLTQHYLTSPTPTLRKSLLDLLGTVSPALAPDEDTFLPAVNALWPVVVARLHDPEPYVVVAACRALCALCESAGDFLATRIKTAWDGWMAKWFAKARREATNKKSGPAAHKKTQAQPSSGGIVLPSRAAANTTLPPSIHNLQLVQSTGSTPTPTQTDRTSAALGGLGRFSQASQVWEAAKELLGAVVSFVRIDDDILDDVLDLLRDDILLGRNESVVRALEDVNADAVWLVRYGGGGVEYKPAPKMEGVTFAPMVDRGGSRASSTAAAVI